jgi:hypothetical protein
MLLVLLHERRGRRFVRQARPAARPYRKNLEVLEEGGVDLQKSDLNTLFAGEGPELRNREGPGLPPLHAEEPLNGIASSPSRLRQESLYSCGR